jgi:organic radical activating enzyme
MQTMNNYAVMEHFYTVQGEGSNTGKAAYFVRLGGCDVGCVWCDVKESWNAADHSQYTTPQIAEWITSAGAYNAVITGGEPCMYNLDELTATLKTLRIQTWLETSGAHLVTGEWDWICVSPKKFKAPLPHSLSIADELKIIIFNNSDFEWAEQHASQVNPNCKLFLQPEYSKIDKMLPSIIEYVKGNPKWTISLQTHKYMQIP